MKEKNLLWNFLTEVEIFFQGTPFGQRFVDIMGILGGGGVGGNNLAPGANAVVAVVPNANVAPAAPGADAAAAAPGPNPGADGCGASNIGR